MNSETLLLPVLKEATWPGREDQVCRPLWEQASSAYMPWVAFGYDHPHTFEFIQTKRLPELQTTAADLEARALVNLCARPVKWQSTELDVDGQKLRMLVCMDDFFAAEHVLDTAFMQQAQQMLNARGLVVGVPRRGVLMATAAGQDNKLLVAFGAGVAGQYSRAQSALISPAVFAMTDGVIDGIVESVAQRIVPDGEPKGPPKDEADDEAAPVVNAIVTRNQQGTEDVVLLAGGPDGLKLAKAIDNAFLALLNEHMARKEFSGHIQVVVLPMTPPAARKHIPSLLEHLRGVCNELSREQKGRYRVSLTYQKDPAQSAPEPRLTVPFAREKADAARLVAAVATGRPPSASPRSPWWRLLPVLPAVIGAVSIYIMTRPPVSFPDSMAFGKAKLSRAGAGHDDNASAAVYVPAGERMPSASLQLGVMVSTAHPTAEELLAWMSQQFRRSDSSGFYDSITGNERCLVGINPKVPRHFVALQLCGTGDGLAACVESDLITNRADIDACEMEEECLAGLCDARWPDERKSLEAVLRQFVR
jgi:hypothetical protein